MRKSTLLMVALSGVVATGAHCRGGGAGKGKNGQGVIPRVSPTPGTTSSTGPVVPDGPRIAEDRTTGTILPDVDERTRLYNMDIQQLNQLGLLTDLYFDLDQYDLRESDRAALVRNGEILKKHDFLLISIEGHADERGTIEYNLALSERRARVAYDYLASIGLGADRMKTLAYGKEIPQCTESNEDCWQRNRRAHFVITGKR